MTPPASPVDILRWQRTVAALHILTDAEQAVADALSRRINSTTGICFPSLKTLAADVGKSVSVAKRCIRKLVRAGLLAVRRTGRGSIYRLLRWVCADPSDRPAATPRSTKETNEAPPLPPKGQKSLELEVDINPDQPPEPADLQIKDNAPVEPEMAAEAPLSEPVTASEPEIAVETPSAPASDAQQPEITEQDVIQAIIAHFFTTTGTRCDQARHRKAIIRALKSHTPDEIKRAATYCATHWSNRAWATPGAVLKPGRVEEVLAQAEANIEPSAAAHRSFDDERTRLPRVYVEQHRRSEEDLRAADDRLVFEIRTGQRAHPNRGTFAA